MDQMWRDGDAGGLVLFLQNLSPKPHQLEPLVWKTIENANLSYIKSFVVICIG